MSRSQTLPAPSGCLRRLLPAALLTFAAVVSLVGVPWSSSRADTSVEAAALDQKVLDEAKANSEIMKNLTYLSDVIGPRLTGSTALKRANEWAAERMKSYGLENVHLEPWTIPVGWERGTAYARVVEPPTNRTLILASMGWAGGTKGKVQGDVVVLNAKSTQDLAKYKGKLKDAVILRGPPMTVRPLSEATPRPAREPAKDEAAADPKAKAAAPEQPPKRFDRGDFAGQMAFRRELAEFLRVEGAAAMLQDAGKPLGMLTTTGSWRGLDRASATEQLPTLVVAHEHYAMLYRLATRPEPARTRIELEVTNKLIPGPIAVYNTVGEIRGSEKPDEFVIVGAHLDSWDLAQGTTDNGTGSCVVLETARILAKSGIKPKRTIRFILFSGEEQGLHGSRAYCEQHKDEMPKTSMAIVHDTGTGKVLGVGLQGREVIKPILERELVSLKPLGFADINLRGMGGSDHSSFEQVGVPGFAVQQDMSEYRLTHHSQSDTLDKAREPDLIQGAQVMAVMALRVANLDNLLPRDKPARAAPKGKGRPNPGP